MKRKRFILQGTTYTNSTQMCRVFAKLAPGKYSIDIQEYDSKPTPPKRRILFKCWWEGEFPGVKYIVGNRAYDAAKEFGAGFDPLLVKSKPSYGRIYSVGNGRRFVVAFYKSV